MKRRMWLLFPVLLPLVDAHAQDARFIRFALKDDLPALKIYALAQDRQRDLWVGTASGLSRFDGTVFHNYFSEANDPHSLAFNVVSDLCCDPLGTVWISTGERLQFYRPATDDFEQVTTPPLIGYIRFTPLDHDRMLVHDVRKAFVMDLRTHALTPMPFIERSIGMQLTFMLADDDRNVWIGTSSGLFKADLIRRTVDRVAAGGLSKDEGFIAERIARIDADRLLITTWGHGFMVLNTANGECAHFNTSTADNITFGCLVERPGRVWIGTDEGASLFNPDTRSISAFNEDRSDPASLVRGLYEPVLKDHEGNIWLGGSGGLVKWDLLANAVRITPITITPELERISGNEVSLIPLGRDEALIASYSGIHHLVLGELQRVIGPIDPAMRGTRYQLFTMPGGRILASMGKILAEVDTARGAINVRTLATLPDLITSVIATSHGGLIVALGDGDLTELNADGSVASGAMLNTGSIRNMKRPIHAMDLFRDRWLLVDQKTHAAVIDLQEHTVVWFSGAPDPTIPGLHVIPVQENYFNSIRFTSTGDLLIASPTNGLLIADRDLKKTTELKVRFPSLDRCVHRIIPAGAERFWLASPSGIYLLDLNGRKLQRFDSNYGIREDEWAGIGVLPDGTLMKHEYDRLLVIDPSRLPQLAAPVTRITGLWVNGARSGQLSDLDLDHDQNNIRVTFTSNSFALHGLKTFRFRLIGGDAQWTDAQNNAITFENLAPGDYRLEVRSTNAQGTPDARPATAGFHIGPPFYGTWWFIALVASVPLLVAYLLFRARIRRLEGSQRIRQRIARDLHDDLGSSMSAITIYGRVLEERLATVDDELGSYAGTIRKAGKAASESIADIVWAEDPSRDEFSHTAARIRAHFLEVSEAAGVNGDITIDPLLIGLRMDGPLRRDLFLIYKEAVNNALKYSGSDRIEIRLERRLDQLWLEVRDHGRGFDPRLNAEGNGSKNMRHRASGIGGILTIESAPGTGTSVRLVVGVA